MKQYQDYYFHKAKKELYPARSIYKLKELDRKFVLFHKGMNVLDLGSAPGSWTMYAAQRVGLQGRILSCDIQKIHIDMPINVTLYVEDIFHRSSNFEEKLKECAPFDIIMSDMAPKTTGTAFIDQARSLDLSMEALALSKDLLLKGGSFVVKIFMGPDVADFVCEMKKVFTKVSFFKPKSSRPESKEVFYLGKYFNNKG